MDEKRCEWCGTLSPADAVQCTLCRIAFSTPVPPPRDWSELTGNIPVITAPLLVEEPARAAAPPAVRPAVEQVPAPVTPAAPVVPQPRVAEPVSAVPAPAAAQDDELPGWRAPDDPTLRVFAERLDARGERRGSNTSVRRRRARRRLGRMLIWTVGLALIVGFLILAPEQLDFI